jgi:LysR family transcriptional regulator, glycine cleavage system transcriptional activator
MNPVHIQLVTRLLPLSGLRAFEAVTRTGSFRDAAADLCLTPSAVSHAVRGLERSLGARLFSRDKPTVHLTAEGERLMFHVDRAFGELYLGISSVSTRPEPPLRLHCAPSMAAQWLMPRLSRLIRDTSLDVRIAASTDYTRFIADEFDVDIVYGLRPPNFYGGASRGSVLALPLGTEVVTPLCAPTLAGTVRTPRSLFDATLIESDNKKVRWPEWFAANALRAPPPCGPRFDRSFLALRAAVDGIGVALESTRLAERELASGQLVRPLQNVCEDVLYTGHWLMLPRAKRYSRQVVRFVEWLSRELGLALDLSALDSATPRKPTASRRSASSAM